MKLIARASQGQEHAKFASEQIIKGNFCSMEVSIFKVPQIGTVRLAEGF